MKKFIKNLAIFSLPFILVLLVFFAFEPYDYFCVRGDATYLSKPLSAMRKIIIQKPDKIILGDSRMANLNTDYIEQISAKRYEMVGFGGSTLGEQLELFWFCTEHTELKKVVFGVSFYMCRGDQTAGRIPVVERQATSTYSFLTSFGNWLEAGNAIKYKTKNLAAAAFGRPEWLEYPEDPNALVVDANPTSERGEKYRQDLEDYAILIYGGVQGYSIAPETYKQISKVIDYCEEHHIELQFVIPPMHESIFEMATEPCGVEPYRVQLLNFLKSRATVYDMEYLNDFTRDENNF
ncbi:MAG: hypothetical protein RSB03_06820, partial [Oscillospiraceae bacterium]